MKERLKPFKYALALLPLVLIVVIGVVVGQAIAGSSAATFTYAPAMADVDQYINAFVTKQAGVNNPDDGEANFLETAATLKGNLDTNGDGCYLCEGDDLSKAPVLVDVLPDASHLIPGTSSYFNYINAADSGNADAVASTVQKHRTAGFSTDIVSYCATGTTEGSVVMAYGAMGQAGYFGSPAPKSLGLKWGRAGWGTPTTVNYTNANPVTASVATPATHSLPGGVPCSSPPSTSDPNYYKEITRCAAAGALGSIGIGTNPPAAGDPAYQPVDIRTTINASNMTMAADGSGTAWALQNPLKNLFTTSGSYQNLVKLDTTKTQLVVNRTQHTAGMVAEGLRMLGYNASFARWGLPMWNNTLPNEKYPGNAGYPYVNGVDTTTPGMGNLTAVANLGGDSATATWNTTKAATTQVVYDTVSHANIADYASKTTEDTIGHSSHSVTLTGLSPNTTYYARAVSYDGMANQAVTGEFEIITSPALNANDYVYYFPWYDSRSGAAGWGGNDWICVANLGTNAVEADVYVGQQFMGKDTIAGGSYKNYDYPQQLGGMVQVRCAGCQGSGDHLTVSDRTLFNGTFHETMALEHTEASGGATQLGTAYSFPWYDNIDAGFIGDWIMVGNADTTNAATVDIYVGDMTTPVKTISNIPPRSVDPNPVQITPQMANGPVKVVSRNGQLIIATQRVLFGNSFNEIMGNKIAP